MTKTDTNMSELPHVQPHVVDTINRFGFEHAATLMPGRELTFHDYKGTRARTTRRPLVYMIVNADGSCWKVGQTGAPIRGKVPKNPGWGRVRGYGRILAGDCGGRDGHESRKGAAILEEVQEGATLWIMLTDDPRGDEHRASEIARPTESGRAATSE